MNSNGIKDGDEYYTFEQRVPDWTAPLSVYGVAQTTPLQRVDAIRARPGGAMFDN